MAVSCARRFPFITPTHEVGDRGLLAVFVLSLLLLLPAHPEKEAADSSSDGSDTNNNASGDTSGVSATATAIAAAATA
jgi:hypothetical protein